jgi:ABC-type glycerol-3-phosphate transport system substrate-binding protein
VEPAHPTGDGPWDRPRSRREILQLGVVLAAGAAVTPLLAACGSSVANAPGASTGPGSGLSGPITVITGGGDPTAEPALKRVYDGFKALHPGIEWDIRALTGGGPEWDRHHLAGSGETTTRAFPLAVTKGVNTTGIFYNKALLDRASLAPPRTIADLKAMVKPLAALGVAPLVHCSGDVFFNQILMTWVLPMIAERTRDPLAFAESTVRGDIAYDSAEWLEAFETIADLRTSGVLLEGSGATDYAAMQQLLLQGKAAMTFNGSWLLPQLLAGSPSVPFDLHVAPPPLVDGASRPRPILSWAGVALPATAAASRDSVYAFLDYASQPSVDRSIVEGLQVYSPIAASNDAITNGVAKEFLPMFEDAITPMDWLWEPEITAEIDSQVQGLVKGDADPGSAAQSVEGVAKELHASGRSYYP